METRTQVKIVDATREHAPFVAWVTLAAFRSHLERGFWDFMLGGPDDAILRYLEALTTTDELHWVHHSIFVVAEVDGRPAAAMCGYFEDELGGPALRLGMLEANRKTGRTEEEAAAGWERAGSI